MDTHLSRQARHARIHWLFLGLGLLTLGGVIGGNLFQERSRIEAREQERLLFTTRIVQQITDQNLSALAPVLADLSRDWTRGDSGRDFNSRLLTLTDALTGARTLSVLDGQGIIQASSRPELLGFDASQRAYFQSIRQAPDPDRLYVSPPHRTTLGVFAINVSRMIPGPSGELAGVVTATLDPEFFFPLLTSVLDTPDMRADLVHGSGDLFMTAPADETAMGKNLAQPGSFFTQHRESGRGANVFSGRLHSTGEYRMLAVRTIQPPALKLDTPLVVGISRGMSGVFASWRREAFWQGGLFCAAVLLSVLGMAGYQKRQRTHAREMADATRNLAENERFIRTITDNIPGMVAYWGRDLRCVYANPAYFEWFGKSREEMQGIHARDLLGEELYRKNEAYLMSVLEGEPQTFERTLVKPDGSRRYTLNRYIPDFEEGQVRGFFVLASDVTELKNTQTELERRIRELDILAYTDHLTGLANRRHFLARAQEEVGRSTRYGQPLVFLMLDIDSFKDVNDAHGHDAGDAVLTSLAETMRAELRATDLTGRLGGEEFGVLLIQTGFNEGLAIAERLRQAFEHICLESRLGALCFTVSIGLAVFHGSEDSLEKLMKRADLALYKAKAAGRNQVCCTTGG
ncbi:sensor domain-containing diguanylate cyclase [Fundidesulfovibrio terrae]|uniref:sensor domain-containing diguanylate cyclase n=1 Tax=Fundidesulfovibrio terrae TaxID=2922866 RepID=UPI001FAF2FB2|nr:diguanylate cyclase [Fundidesulfovibrio terrae]